MEVIRQPTTGGIPANTSQVIATRLIPRASDTTDKVTVTANETSAMGVEVQCLDY